MIRRALVTVSAAGALLATAQTAGATTSQGSAWRLSTATHPVRDALGRVWQADRYAFGGRIERRTDTVENTASPQLFRTRREGVKSYSIPVGRRGTYAVTLYLSEDRGVRPGARVFDVLAEGAVVAGRVDTAARMPGAQPDHLVFTTPVRDGRLTLRFVAHAGRPQLSAVKVLRMSASTTRPQVRWRDEFAGPAGTRPAPGRWVFDHGAGRSGWGNQELEAYTDRPENVALDGAGSLAITARRETFTAGDGQTQGYTSARVKTYKKFSFTYGEMAARIRVPTGNGIWPAFWAVGERVQSIGWPESGEIDVFEVLGSDPTKVAGSVHGPATTGRPYAATQKVKLFTSAADGFHVYSALWVPGAIQMRLDGLRYATYTPEDLGPHKKWVFDQPFHLLLNVAVGGTGAGPAPDATTPFPATMLVDWVRVRR
ncbi:MAG TPA: family 16 glycosylhydrolase [Baekduia sp.]|nr:family 16 glycosylhydrolase [Baekduia sp.]